MTQKPRIKDELTSQIQYRLTEEIFARKKAEEKIRETAEEWEITFNSISDFVSIQTKDYRIVKVNKAFADAFKVKPEELSGKHCYELVHEDQRPCPDCPFEHVLKTKKPKMSEFFEPHLGVYVQVSVSPIFNTKDEIIGNVHIVKDITERKQAENQIKASLEEKEILLREIHHRVKNNLQIMSSLLALQSEHFKDEQVIERYKESHNRIRSMALIHEKLYQSEGLRKIDFKDYIEDLVSGLYGAYHIDSSRILPKIKVKDVSMGINTAIPCGLIINELVTNSLKHAFPAPAEEKAEELEIGRTGEIKITLEKTDENEIELLVRDSGIGIPEDIDFRGSKTLGLHLVAMLAENQLQGKIELDRSGGTKFQITFKEVI